MISTQLTPKQIIREISRLRRNISKRLSNVEGLGDTAPQYAINRFRDLEKDIPKNLRTATESKLRTIYRDLRYINSLKSSTYKGAKNIQQTFEPIKEKLNALSPETRNKFWEMYGKLYERTSGTLENFKYQIFQTNIDYIYSGTDVDTSVEEIIREYDKTLETLGEQPSDEEIKLLFTEKLQSLRK